MLTETLIPATDCPAGDTHTPALPTYGLRSWFMALAFETAPDGTTVALEEALSASPGAAWRQIATKPAALGVVTLAGLLSGSPAAQVRVTVSVPVGQTASLVSAEATARAFDPADPADAAVLKKDTAGFSAIARVAQQAEADVLETLTIRGASMPGGTPYGLALSPFGCWWSPTPGFTHYDPTVVEFLRGAASTTDVLDFALAKPGAVAALKLEIARQVEHLYLIELLRQSGDASAQVTLRGIGIHAARLGERLKRYRNSATSVFRGR